MQDKLDGLPVKTYYRPDEVADFFSRSQQTVRRWCRDGKLRSVRVQGRILISREAISEVIRLSSECYN